MPLAKHRISPSPEAKPASRGHLPVQSADAVAITSAYNVPLASIHYTEFRNQPASACCFELSRMPSV
ncbi:hypothetical protein GGP41_004595 [Bipolaris sorokiniana]|uniref:Uncharacterized protein n=1 Tax=Cochliobolus sativus TaxID=45130 RepID=A0A8H5ZEE8_COCSA|nr:hypothetical protein GGP41_004595 [Bipolaris sorokiniana]